VPGQDTVPRRDGAARLKAACGAVTVSLPGRGLRSLPVASRAIR
jgi:hypothetical protein